MDKYAIAFYAVIGLTVFFSYSRWPLAVIPLWIVALLLVIVILSKP